MDQVPDAVRARSTERCLVESGLDNFLYPSFYYTLDDATPPYDPVLLHDVRLSTNQNVGRDVHVVVLGLAADGSVLYRGEGEQVISDGATFVIVCGTVGP
jgi:hypothetical protein